MYEVEVVVDIFRDIITKKEYKKGDRFTCDKQRGASLIVKGICKLISEREIKKGTKQEDKEK